MKVGVISILPDMSADPAIVAKKAEDGTINPTIITRRVINSRYMNYWHTTVDCC